MNRSRDLDPVPDMHAAAEDRTPPLCQINKRHVCAFCCPTQSVSASYLMLFVELHPCNYTLLILAFDEVLVTSNCKTPWFAIHPGPCFTFFICQYAHILVKIF